MESNGKRDDNFFYATCLDPLVIHADPQRLRTQQALVVLLRTVIDAVRESQGLEESSEKEKIVTSE